ncbi:uncharacterized protein K460DRAFT_399743 [Cucurbitaria berberidis CBS 394.84]|uniref:BTB domain-containing protein n=1 Tax=Cucurbitaria berberidis CBS 394.84 TaxID=1168544 RepID=A0A9P4GQ23_9PLEO|nr:uncharacterized protein K460DRAFT_399743 [Cucurbitaria berberidis CBS 394.84]KAF1849630.1 hypothetical protein K460DRAFT_399743 [Cucurbitaria berberidis CBS 394.84]
MSLQDDSDWTGKTGAPVPDQPGDTFTFQVGNPSKCFRVHKNLLETASWISRRIKHAQFQSLMESILRKTLEDLMKIRHDLSCQPGTVATVWVLNQRAIWGLFRYSLLNTPDELRYTAADVFLILLDILRIPDDPGVPRNVFTSQYIWPRLGELEDGDNPPKFASILLKAISNIRTRLQQLDQRERVSAGHLVLHDDDPEVVTMFIRALWSNNLQAQEPSGQLRDLSWSELVNLHAFAKRMDAELLVERIKFELQRTLSQAPNTIAIETHMTPTIDQDIRQLCTLELMTRRLRNVGMTELDDSSTEDWEMIEQPQMVA